MTTSSSKPSSQATPDQTLSPRATKVKGLKLVTNSLTSSPRHVLPGQFWHSLLQPGGNSKCVRPGADLNAGYTGVGETIIIIVSFGSPTIAQDLQTFDADYGLPDPPSFTVLAPLGTVPFDPTNSDQVGWAFETTLDVEWAQRWRQARTSCC